MPLEIKELHVRIAVDAKPQQQAGAAGPAPEAHGAAEKDSIVAECVEQVMHLLQARKER